MQVYNNEKPTIVINGNTGSDTMDIVKRATVFSKKSSERNEMIAFPKIGDYTNSQKSIFPEEDVDPTE